MTLGAVMEARIEKLAKEFAAGEWSESNAESRLLSLIEDACGARDEEIARLGRHEESHDRIQLTLQQEVMDAEARVAQLEAAARFMLDLEARRMYERDVEADAACPCPCPGCDKLRNAVGAQC